MILDLTPSNRAVYEGCEVVRVSQDRYNLVTPIRIAVAVIARNILEIVSQMPADDRQELVLTGAAKQDIYLTAQSVAGPFFKKVIRLNGITGERVEIPQSQPPLDFQNESED
ncbi:MAG: hypothetical protein JWO00_328 [Candidatus Parcubacteria bacterium]|nr:hypothetical protein [Candidatus Parcubacteria bacterium]